ncbi:hypothetical protein PR048_033201, partial [Dryococelus australis]
MNETYITERGFLVALKECNFNFLLNGSFKETLDISYCIQKLKEAENIIANNSFRIIWSLFQEEPPTKKQRKSEEINPECSYRYLGSEQVAKFNLSEFRSKSVLEIMELLKQSDLNLPSRQQVNLLSTLSSLKESRPRLETPRNKTRYQILDYCQYKKKIPTLKQKQSYSDVMDIFMSNK